eukprot:15926-Heterococcus_DN1.PRE.2
MHTLHAVIVNAPVSTAVQRLSNGFSCVPQASRGWRQVSATWRCVSAGTAELSVTCKACYTVRQ